MVCCSDVGSRADFINSCVLQAEAQHPSTYLSQVPLALLWGLLPLPNPLTSQILFQVWVVEKLPGPGIQGHMGHRVSQAGVGKTW